ncbi:UvrD-helicase domain-containing protein [Candidatus Gracilibacteria bacterium]|nr:UvrD-helicase domain-containing protein [Candidatus Gracilibacteria bacterium]
MSNQKEFIKRYNNLNPEQKKAVDTIDGPVMVVAGPGMGKTELLSLRVANILKQTDTPPESILCLTFTDSAAQNMLERLKSLIGKEAYNIAIHTFHSFATEIINHNPEFFFDGAKFQPADDLQQIKILSKIIDNLLPSSPLSIPNKDFKHNHIRNIKQAISNIKKEGFLATEFQIILQENEEILTRLNPILNEFFNINWRSNSEKQNTFDKFPKLVKTINQMDQLFPESKFQSRGIKKISTNILNSLEKISSQLKTQQKLDAKPFYEFRNNYLKKNSQGEYVLIDLKNLKNNYELAKIYDDYKKALYKEGLFDFDDMLIEVNKSLQENPELSYNYKEKYLYILVDEFQDTNLSQSQLLDNLIDLEVTNNYPNIMVVGDDDQAIYKFQGANIENILNFQEKYINTKFITLHRNYRSHQKILDLAKNIIEDCQIRLTDKTFINKDLKSEINQKSSPVPIIYESNTRLQQLNHLAKTIQNDIHNGVDPTDIVVLVKKHKQFNDFINILNYYKIPIRYERSNNILTQKYIQEIIIILKFINSILSKDLPTQDEYLNQILSFEMFKIKPLCLYKLSQRAYLDKLSWLDVLNIYSQENHKDSQYIGQIHQFLLNLANESQHTPVEIILDKILGLESENTPTDEHQDIEENKAENIYQPLFSLKKIVQNKPDYLIFLSALKTFIDSLRKYKPKQVIFVHDVIDYINLLQENEIPINDNSPYNQEEKAVQLMTVFKSKGLEFEKVYILDCNNSYWNSKKVKIQLLYPKTHHSHQNLTIKMTLLEPFLLL